MNASVAQKYAQALLSAITDRHQAKAEQLVMIAQNFQAQPTVFRLLEDPRLSTEEKQTFIAQTCAGADNDVIEFIQLIAKNQRGRELPAIAEYFEMIVLAMQGKQKAVVTTATALDKETLAILIAAAEKRTMTKLVSTHVIDPSIIGGVKVSVGTQTFDDSFATKLQKLQSDLQKLTI